MGETIFNTEVGIKNQPFIRLACFSKMTQITAPNNS